MKTAPPIGGHVFQQTRAMFELSRAIIKTSNLTKQTAPPSSDHFFKTGTIFEHSWDIIITNVMTKFHYDWTIYVISRVLTSFFFNLTYFKLDQDIIGPNLWTKVDEEQTKMLPVESLRGKMLTTDDARRTKGDPKTHNYGSFQTRS
ncbi:hypothetical protein DPMN_129871 [Dreissena polymorpha]|uniref:Uncharacterized protein n=1 Tax=Dreissena polymorpha TaxID=45954 RepID=A0A9D4H5K2_DREPO|nr:hypothetical protein DPMN_129871 [Dreissena polymorpha]